MSKGLVLVIGGGAAGLAAAITAARAGASVIVLERDARVGRKILASGNGRCNLTNTCVTPEAYNCATFVAPVLGGFSGARVREFFGEMGLLTVADEAGRAYPSTNVAGSVLDVLRLECDRLGVEIRCESEAAAIAERRNNAGFEVRTADGAVVACEAVVVATCDASLLAGTAHSMVAASPVLGPIRTQTAPIRGLSGVRVRCAASILAPAEGGSQAVLATERGELLFRDYGVSGIMVFDLSRFLVPDCTLSIDFFPDVSADELESMLRERVALLGWRSTDTFFSGMLHDRVSRALLRAADVRAAEPVERMPMKRLAGLLKGFRLRVTGMGDAAQSQVTRGGVCVAEFNPATMESELVNGLFAAGEVLDVDGRSGGFNLHWAWASGIVAGEAAAEAAARVGSALSETDRP